MSDPGDVDLQNLRVFLQNTSEVYVHGDLEQQRRAVLISLAGVVRYFQEKGFPPQTLSPILRPAIALIDRENSALDQMFSVRSRKGRSKKTFEENIRTGILAGFADGWLQLHQNDDRAQPAKLAEAARHLQGPWFGDVSRAKLETARETVSGEAKDHLAVLAYGWFADAFQNALAEWGPSQAFSRLVGELNENSAGRVMGILKTVPLSSPDKP